MRPTKTEPSMLASVLPGARRDNWATKKKSGQPQTPKLVLKSLSFGAPGRARIRCCAAAR
jgi:hypothetical protein